MKKMSIVVIVAVALVAAVFLGCKYVRGQILDGPGMERDTTDLPVEEPVDGLNKEAILDGPTVRRHMLSREARTAWRLSPPPMATTMKAGIPSTTPIPWMESSSVR
jgi:hypothetical protein